MRLPTDYWHNCRPSLVEFGRRAPYYDSGVSDVVVKGVTLRDSPFWTFSGRGLKRAVISGVHVNTTGCGYGEAPNTDGFNVQGEDILIEDCTVRNGDDCVPIFPPSNNVVVRNISCECGNGVGPVIWPAMSVPGEGGMVQNVVIQGAKFLNTWQAVVIKSLESFVGRAENVTYQDFALDNVATAVMVSMFDQHVGHRAISTPSAAQLLIRNVTGTVKAAGHFSCGAPSAGCEGVVMENVSLQAVPGVSLTGYDCVNATGVARGCDPAPCGWV
eukprot:TRINITY_DN39999_c0_g1_i1.p1 TRINITY_DN39999_c0_g1~~TRINITY_DN39999_c0_g1_i1.p1  ORF type:complete len:272 (+),score=20.78 TRINITY_DN39999_c0_g1_i1:243-1058(+)